MDYRYVFTTCNNCGAITAIVDLKNDEMAGWSWYDNNKKVPSYDFLQNPCCSGNSHVNAAVCLHFTNDRSIIEEGD